MDSEMRPLDRVLAECMAKSGAIASVQERDVEVTFSMATALDAVIDMGKENVYFGRPLERKKQVDRVRTSIKRMVKGGFMGEVPKCSDGSGKGYYVYEEEFEKKAVEVPVEKFDGLEIKEKAKPQKTTDEERMARPEWGQKLTLKVYKEWLAWSADFTLRKLCGGLALENKIDLPEDFTNHDLCAMWGDGGSGFNERKLIKQLREKFPAAESVKK